jgi:ADP-heptose:LPS heptosyltransferase
MPERIIFLRLGALGDILVSLSALAWVANNNPGKEIVVCGNRLWFEIIRSYPQFNVRKIYVFTDKYTLDEFSHTAGEWQGTGRKVSFFRLCRKARAIYNLRYESLRYSWLAFFARTPLRYGSAPRFFRFLFTHWFGWLGEEPPIHERDWLNAIVAAPAVVKNPYRSLKYNLKLLAEKNAERSYGELNNLFLPAMNLAPDTVDLHKRYGLVPQKYILINPTASRRDKAWPAERFRALADFLSASLPEWKLYVIGSPAETEWLQEAQGNQTILQPQNLRDLFCVVRNAAALVTNTSSMQFIASANRVPTLTLMGQADPIRWGPLGPGNLVIRGTPSRAKDKFSRDEEAYRSIPLEQVKELAVEWLRTNLESTQKKERI